MARPRNGRPSKFRAEYLHGVEQYIYDRLKEGKMPFKEGLALRLGVDVDTLANWGKANKRFLGLMRKLETVILDEAQQRLFKQGQNVTGVSLYLQAQRGWAPISKQINEGKQPVTIQVDMSGGYLPPKASTQPPKPIPAKAKHN